MIMENILETFDLSKSYGKLYAVDHLNIHMQQGSICAFLGQNGAGKSTTLRMLLGMIHPTSGTGKIFGYSIDDENGSINIRKRVAFVAEDKRLYDYMTVEQLIRFTRSFFPAWREDLAEKLRARFELPVDRKIRKLSKGMRTKLALILAVGRGSDLLILDEPTEGLDPVAVEILLETIVSLTAEGKSILFSSHQIAEVEQISDHVLIINHGKLILDAEMDKLKEDYKYIRIIYENEQSASRMNVNCVKMKKEGPVVSVISNGNVEEIIGNAELFGATNIDVEPIALKEIFLEMVKPD
jgi:ABC-2 type transport system ATP-binding protein